MTRSVFSKATKREALLRSGGECEAVGAVYGWDPGQRCSALLSYGVEFDHYPIRSADGGSNKLTNCAAVCIKCHSWKTRTFDTPQAAKGKRVSDKHQGIAGPKRTLKGPGFRRQPTNSRDINADLDEAAP